MWIVAAALAGAFLVAKAFKIKWLEDLVSTIAAIIVIAFVAYAVIVSGGVLAAAGNLTWQGWLLVVVGLVVGWERIIDWVLKAIDFLIDLLITLITAVVTGLVKAFASSPIGLAVIAFGIFYFLSASDSSDRVRGDNDKDFRYDKDVLSSKEKGSRTTDDRREKARNAFIDSLIDDKIDESMSDEVVI